ncbi:MAG TPA: LamG-like jellyroll fold domain-containing protein, partial [Candidatus Dormibacteraeota bacterium]|nr:LamG-like jellyroll fold domain-containing protein [Candidatus Dormibacteraeota bacterium]
MRKVLLTIALTCLALLANTTAWAQSGAFFQAVTNLHPIGYWPLTETTSPPGSKPAANNSGTLGAADNGAYNDGAFPGVAGALAGVSDTAGLFSGASGVNSRVTVPYDSAYASQTNLTIELWLNSALNDPGTECLVNCLDVNSPRAGWLLYCDNPVTAGAANFNFRTYATNGTTASVNYVIPVPGGHILSNTWYHVVVTFNGIQARGYINGQAATPATTGTIVGSTAGPFAIGARNDSSFAFAGFIDEVAFYSNVLTASDILAHYQAGTNPAPATAYQQLVLNDNPQLYYRLNDAAAPIAQNYGTAGAFARGYYESGTAPGAAGPAFAGFGSPSYACNFSGGQSADIGPSVIVPGAAGLPIGIDSNSPMTFTMWAQASVPPNYFTTAAGKGDQSYRFDINDGSGVAHWNAGNENEIAAGPNVADNNWHFWAGTWDGSNIMNLYIDGLLAGQSTGNDSANGSAQPFLIGTAPDDTGRNMQGSICHVALFGSALTTAQIQNLWFAAGAPPAITTQPLPTIAMQGSNVSITVSAFGKPPLSYQWYTGTPGSGTPVSGGNISGATTTALTFTSVQPANHAEYYVVVTDGNSLQTTSVGVTLSVLTSALAGTYFPAVVNLNPLGYWPLNETNSPPYPDVATNYGTLGTAGNAAYPTSGITRQQQGALTDGDTAILTDASGGAVTLPFSPVLGLHAPFSVEGWLVAGQSASIQCALSCVNAGSTRSGWLIYANGVNAGSYNFRLYNQNGGNTSLSISSPVNSINPGQYYHVVAVYDGSQGYLYINGQLADSATPTGFVANDAGNLTIGARSDKGFGFQGAEDEVAIYTNALSAATILAHYMAGTNTAPSPAYNQLVLQSSPILYYRLNEPTYTAPPLTSNPVATNYGASGSAENGYYLPGSGPGAVAGPSFTGLPGHTACHFNAAFSSGIVEVPDQSAGLNVVSPVTLTAWIKGDAGNIGNFQSFAGRGDDSYRGDVDQSGSVHFADGGNSDAVGTFVNDGAWHFFAGTWDGANEVIYIDGVSNRSQSAEAFIAGSSNPFVIGGDGQYSVGASPSRIFNGGVSEVAVFGKSLSAEQVQTLYNAALVPPYIVTQPSPSIFSINTTGSLTVQAGGTPTLFYQWYKGTTSLTNAGDISGANTTTLTISP